MTTETVSSCALTTALLILCGCQPSPGGGSGNGNFSGNDNFNGTKDIDLGDNGRFELTGGTPADRQITVSLADELGVNQLTGLGFAIGSNGVTVQPTAAAAVTSNGLTTLDGFVAPTTAADACSSGVAVGRFDISFDANGIQTITPAQLDAGADALMVASNGVFELCLRAASEVDQTLVVSRLQVRFAVAVPSGLTCAEILALSDVQAALSVLNSNGLSFALPAGDSPPNIEHTYAVSETVEFDPDGTDTGVTHNRVDTFSSQTADQVTRSSGTAAMTQSISGSETGVNLCAYARTNHPACDQTIARLESYTSTSGGTSWSGQFLAVVVDRYTTGASACGQKGDFIYGSIDLSRQGTTSQVTRLGKVGLPVVFDPEFLVLPDDGTSGTVTDRNTPAVVRFPQDGTSVTTPLAIPGGLTVQGYKGIALSRDDRRVALVSRAPDEVLVFDNTDGSLVLEATANGASLGGDVFDFSTNGQFVYVVSPDPGNADNISVFATSAATADPLVDQFPTPDARTPDLSRLNPAGDQLAVLLHGDADEGNSQWLTFLDSQFTTPIDLRQATGGFVSARYVVYTSDGSRVFLAGRTGVVAVDAVEPFTVTPIDVSGGRGDAAVAVALSNDGAVLVVAVDKINGDANFAIVDAQTLVVLKRQLLSDIYDRGAIDVVHFRTGRVCLVINERLRVVPVQTTDPYTVGETLSAADNEFAVLLGRAAVGGNVIAVANTAEPAIYLYELAP